MDKKNNKNLKANKNNNQSTARTEFAEEMNFDSSKKSNKYNSNKHSNCNTNK
ncbi:hypothetical protein [[Clostridium] colinum]|uniref:hypothetical protein n=1 Tax=[Clostridium] colinum TaxID=36835 RepID=UPI002024E2B3|nr:hypothetical protein [[Clostridium] colinum]